MHGSDPSHRWQRILRRQLVQVAGEARRARGHSQEPAFRTGPTMQTGGSHILATPRGGGDHFPLWKSQSVTLKKSLSHSLPPPGEVGFGGPEVSHFYLRKIRRRLWRK
jgi:hypothetical protein